MDKKRITINMIAQLTAFVVNTLLGLVLVPVIERLIPSAYGFTDIANKFVSAAQIIASALNTMASRYITIRIHRNEEQEAQEYFSSVFFANVLMAAVFMVPMLFVIVYLGSIFNIPAGASLPDVQMLFFFIFLNFAISIITSVFSVASYSKDRLDLSSISTVMGELTRLAVLAICYVFLRPYLFYVGCASVASTVIQAIANFGFTKKLLPSMRLRLKNFRWRKVWELVSLGAWNSVTRLGQLLLEGLNTTIANIMISAEAMTTISIPSFVTTTISNLMGTIAGVFNPQMTIAYAKEDRKSLLEIIASADRIMIYIISIPLAFITVFGKSFFQLWVGETQNAGQLYIITLLSVGTTFVSGSIQVLYHVFLLTKKVRLNSMVIVSSGVLTVATVFILLKTTNLGMYAIVGCSTFYGLLRNLLFTPLYASRCLNVKWNTFYGDIFLGLVSIGILCIVCLPFELLIDIDSWFKLIGVGVAAGLLCLVVNFFVALRRVERQMILDMLKGKLLKKQ